MIVPGWERLSDCFPVTSFDGVKTLSFSEDHVVTLGEKLEATSAMPEREISGRWYYDDGRRRYTISLKDDSRQYELITPENSNVCILAVGDTITVNLRESWFGTTPSEPMDDY